MNAALFRIRAWLRYRFAAKNRHGVHSPFVYALNENVFPPSPTDDFSAHPAEAWRSLCLNNFDTLEVTDFGTGTSGPRVIASIAQRSAKSARAGQFLHRLVRHLGPTTMLELGTSLGITTLYQHTAAPAAKFITLEGCAQTAAMARDVFAQQHTGTLVRAGAFEATLLPALQELRQVDYVFFDGNHREAPTRSYFETCLPFAHADTVFVFDDIHWSPEMESAWAAICAHPKVTVSIDVFDFGLVFFREVQVKEAFVIRW